MQRALFIMTILYCLGLATSMAGMEAFSTLMVLVTVVSSVLHLIKKQKPQLQFSRLGPDWALWGFWITVAVGAFTITVLPKELAPGVVGRARWILSLYTLTAVWTFLKDENERVFLFLIGTIALVAVYSLIQSQTGVDLFRGRTLAPSNFSGYEVWRARGFFSNTMAYTYSIGVILSFLFASLMIGMFKGRRKTYVAACTVLISSALIMTFTRGAWIGIFVSLLVMLTLWNWRKGIKIAAALISVIVLISLFNKTAALRISSIYEEKAGTSVSQRWDLWSANWAMFKDHPLLGVGYDQTTRLVQEYNLRLKGQEGFVADAHNNFIQTLAGTGVLGFTLWIYFCGYFFVMAIRLWRQNRGSGNWPELVGLGSIGAQTFFHVGGLTQATFYDWEPLHIFVFMWALMISQSHLSSTATEKA